MGNVAHRVGNQKLQWNDKTEQFVGNDQANKLLKRTGKDPYQIPDPV